MGAGAPHLLDTRVARSRSYRLAGGFRDRRSGNISLLIPFDDLDLPPEATARLVVALEDIGEDRLAYRIDRAAGGKSAGLVLTADDHAAILRALSARPIAELADLPAALEEHARRATPLPGRDDRMVLRETRMAANEAFFRSVNERLEQQTPDSHVLVVLCECADEDCAQRLELTRAEYEDVRADPAQFVVAHGHADPEIEDVVGHTDRYERVRKVGVGLDVAKRLE